MTKELSKQLCELCGVESKEECGYNCPYHDEEAPVCAYQQENDGCYKHYPDFGKPNNFVKLLELKIYNYSIGFYVYKRWETNNRKEFIDNLLSFIDEQDKEDKEFANKIKQTIKNAEWEY